MNLMRASRLRGSVQPARFNRYTGGIDRRHTLIKPPSTFARMYSAATAEEINSDTPVELPDDQLLEAKNMKIAELEQSIKEAKDNWKLALAETDNLSKRMSKEITKRREGGTEKLAKGIFSVGDIFDLCLQNKPDLESEEHRENVQLHGAFDGLLSAKSQLSSILHNTANVVEIAPQPGDNFDPMLHNARFEIEHPTIDPGQIAIVMKSGYAKGDLLLRPADVGIVKFVPTQQENNNTENKTENNKTETKSKGKVFFDEDDASWPEMESKK